MSFKNAKEYLKKYGLENNIMEFNISSATVKDASIALSCKEEQIAKTLAFYTDKPILIVTAGDKKIDNAKFKGEFHVKARMINIDELDNLIGHKIGGVCPFGIKDNVDVYLDVSLKKFDVVYPACGSSNSAVKLTLDELEKISNYKSFIDVCK